MRLSVRVTEPSKPPKVGRCRDLVLIHGTGANAHMWRGQIDLLNDAGHRCFLVDLRGHGESAEQFVKSDIEVQLADLLETLPELEIELPAVFIGHSLGAILSMVLAERRPEMVHTVLAVGMPGKVLVPVKEAFRWFLNGPFEKIKGSSVHERLPWREKTLLSTDKFTLEQIVENFQTLDYASAPPNVQCPVHFSVGRWDPVAPAPYVVEMHKKISQSSLKIIEWAGHNCMDSQPAQFNTWLSSVISTIPARD